MRHGGVALPALTNGRRALPVRDAAMWDPVTSSPVQSRQWRAARDIPQIWALNDMGADGRGDFLVQDPDQLTWTRWYSTQGRGYTAQPTLALG